MSQSEAPEMAAKYPSWLPRPLTGGYIQKVETELYRREIQRRKHHAPGMTSTPQFTTYCSSVGLDPDNARANRYIDIYPYDKSRLLLPSGAYLNASWVKERAGGKWMVATQAPLERTAHTFLSMFLEPVTPSHSIKSPPAANRLRTIVQLTPNIEGNTAKAFQYFPKRVGEEMIWTPPNQILVPPIKVKLLQMSRPEDGGGDSSWIHSVLELSYEDDQSPKHLVRHIHYLFMQFVEACNQDTSHIDASKNPDPPIVVGCSAGVGRTGTFIALASLLRYHNLNRPINLPVQEKTDASEADWSGDPLPESPFGPLPQEIQNDLIALEVDYLRDQRPLMVQSREQLRFLYQVFPAVMQLERGGDSN
ncbi:11644_t:CDS:2 [Acaulospora colombiana]|uniref:11644_t:CDS:1 n=1 Tax=Acaulospora colombiana TaxID=27376 RepID=A0ACA9L671_9GLOM|nr:11644_t:CDS:2 [Acaulospora colombiana]